MVMHLKDEDVLPILLGLQEQLLDGSVLLVQESGGLQVESLLPLQVNLEFLDSGLHLLDGDPDNKILLSLLI